MINTINHIGIGVFDASDTWAFFKNNLGFKLKMNELKQDVEEWEPLLKIIPKMRVINCGCFYGGGFIEIIQYLSRPPQPKEDAYQWSNTGFLEAGIQVIGLKDIYHKLKQQGFPFLTGLEQFALNDSIVWDSVYVASPDGFIVRLLDTHNGEKVKKPLFAGINHVTIGVRDLDKAVSFYQEVMGFDRILYRGQIAKEKLHPIMPCHDDAEMVILDRSQGSTAIMSTYTGGMIFLVRVNAPERKSIYQNRSFGDPGISELGFDVNDIRATYDELVRKGAKPVVEPLEFDWFPGPKGALAYVADDEGNLLELIETQKVYGINIATIDKMSLQPMRRWTQKGYFV